MRFAGKCWNLKLGVVEEGEWGCRVLHKGEMGKHGKGKVSGIGILRDSCIVMWSVDVMWKGLTLEGVSAFGKVRRCFLSIF